MKNYARVITDKGPVLVPLEVNRFGEPFAVLFEKAPVTGEEVFAAYSHDAFRNPFHDADAGRYAERRYWAEVFRDSVQTLGIADLGRRMPVIYRSNGGATQEILLPPSGLWIPVGKDRSDRPIIFYPGTVVPYETLPFEEKKVAQRVLEQYGVPREELSAFHQPPVYEQDRTWYVGRDFSVRQGHFRIRCDVQPQLHAPYVGTRYSNGDPSLVVMDVDARSAASRR